MKSSSSPYVYGSTKSLANKFRKELVLAELKDRSAGLGRVGSTPKPEALDEAFVSLEIGFFKVAE